MKIYIDFDDVICETGKSFSNLAEELFGVKVSYSQMTQFNMQKAFGLTDEQHRLLLDKGHAPEMILSYEETPGASLTINKWLSEGHEVKIITGRPFDAYESSRKWLDEHNLKEVSLTCVDKYGREQGQDWSYGMTLAKLYEMDFDFAVEDSPVAFEILTHFKNCTVAVFDRPWNDSAQFPDERFNRCLTWEEADRLLQSIQS